MFDFGFLLLVTVSSVLPAQATVVYTKWRNPVRLRITKFLLIILSLFISKKKRNFNKEIGIDLYLWWGLVIGDMFPTFLKL